MKEHEFFRNTIGHSTRLAFGCSHTWGVGVESYQTWAHLLGAKNYGIGGASANQVTRIAKEITAREYPTDIFVLWPEWTRFEYVKNGRYQQCLATDSDRIYQMAAHSDEWCKKNFYDQIQSLQQFCCKRDVTIIDMTLYDLIPFINHADTWPISKLGHHYAAEWHQKVAGLFEWAKHTQHKFPLVNE